MLKLFFWTWLFSIGLMTQVYFLAARKKQVEWVDVAWVFNFFLIVLIVIVSTLIFVGPLNEAQMLIAAMLLLWSLRLGLFLYFTRIKPKQVDQRYLALAKRYGKNQAVRFFIFFQTQGLTNALFAFVIFVPFIYAPAQISMLQIFCFGLWLLALIGETIADFQLYRFKQNKQNQGQVCQVGLWRYSRHPNYFFEWLNWWALAFFSWGLPSFELTLLAPLMISFFLFGVTGIPANERQALKSKGQAYAQYQKETSVFVPWFVKKI